jgi:chromate transporter
MRDEFVRRRAWIDDATFIDLLGASNLIPGPTSTELAMHVGHRRAGLRGLVVAGLAFLLPAVAIVGILAAIYVAEGTRPEVGAVLVGVAPVVVAIVAHAGASIGRVVLARPIGALVAVLGAVGVLIGVAEIIVLVGLGLASMAGRVALDRFAGAPPIVIGGIGPVAGAGGAATIPTATTATTATATVAAAAAATAAVAPLLVLAEFLKIGAVLFGSGYVLVALLRSELVEGLGWISETQLVDAIAVGQATPGPLFSSATFIGYLVGGPVGAVAATIGIFLPAFLVVALTIPVLARLRRSAAARAFLDGVNAASVGLLGVVAAQLAVGTLRDALAVVVALAAFVLVTRGVGTAWLIAAGAGVGLLRLAS